jgi:polyferredoxin
MSGPSAAPPIPPATAVARGTDLLRWPWIGSLLRWRHARLVLQLPLLALSAALVLHGLFGPGFSSRNLATVGVWVHYRGLLVFGLLVAGNLFCMACPFLVPRDLARRWLRPRLHWPRPLRNKWVAVALFALMLFAYEHFDWWASPRATALLVVGYFAAALVVDALFRNASFCKFVCPIGQFNFVSSTLSPLEIRVGGPRACAACTTHDCIRGRRGPGGATEVRGCELALYQPLKRGNVDCTFCLDCVHACPHHNVVIAPRLPGSELWEDPRRSGIGQFSRRPDLSALVLVFTFGALLNAFGMVSPVYAVLDAIARGLRLPGEAPALAILFGVGLVAEPALLVGIASWATRRATGSRESLLAIGTRHAYALAPIGFGVWLAHYAFHFLTGLLTVIPVAQAAAADLGAPVLGVPAWGLGGLPPRIVQPIETGLLVLGLTGSWIVAWRTAEREASGKRVQAFAPWAVLALVLFVAAMWLLSQPMEMRGTSP